MRGIPKSIRLLRLRLTDVERSLNYLFGVTSPQLQMELEYIRAKVLINLLELQLLKFKRN